VADNAELKTKKERFFNFLKNRSLCSALFITRHNTRAGLGSFTRQRDLNLVARLPRRYPTNGSCPNGRDSGRGQLRLRTCPESVPLPKTSCSEDRVLRVIPNSEEWDHAVKMRELNECQTTFAITLPVINTNNKDIIYDFNQNQSNRTPPRAHEEGRRRLQLS
jgi:hypothetical protein